MGVGMKTEYQMEQLLPLVAKLTDKYTSKESSSVTYETASMLMEAVIYTLDECFAYDTCVMDAENNSVGADAEAGFQTRSLVSERKSTVDASVMYDRGKELILEKVYQAKSLYEAIAMDFVWYGCRNYKDTVLKGMPAFFTKYDPLFKPQDHILTLDYPLLCRVSRSDGEELRGVDLILYYLKCIQAEQWFLKCFAPEAVQSCLRELGSDFPAFYMDNLCQPVLWRALECMIADRPAEELKLESGDAEAVAAFFAGEDREKVANRLRGMIGLLLKKAGKEEYIPYFAGAAREYAVRVAEQF